MKTLKLFLLAFLAATPAMAQAPATPVIVTIADVKEFADEIEALGTLKAKESIDLASSVTERVTKVSFEDNQRVAQGDVLLEMDATEEHAELAEQKSYMKEAQRQVNRLSPLVAKGAASAAILDENRRELEGARARVNAIQARIDQRIIKAPFDGVLGLRNISVGALAQTGAMITTLDDDSVMKLDFSVPEVFLSSLKTGVMIEATTTAYPNTIFKGRISNVDSRIDPVTRSIEARALIENAERLLKPGLLMQVALKKNIRDALLIPEEALTANGADNFVFVVHEGAEKTSAERRKVEIGSRQYGVAEITSGLKKGEMIVTHGTLRVRPDAPLTITAIEENGESLDTLLNGTKHDKSAKE